MREFFEAVGACMCANATRIGGIESVLAPLTPATHLRPSTQLNFPNNGISISIFWNSSVSETCAVATRPSHLFDGPTRAVACRPHPAIRNGQPRERGVDRRTRTEHDHGEKAARAVSHFCLWAKRSEAGRFISDWRHVRHQLMDWTALKLLLEGIEPARRRKRSLRPPPSLDRSIVHWMRAPL